VKEAIKKSSDEKFAIKIMDKRRFTSSQLDLIKMEVKLMDVVKGHKNVVRLYEVYESNEFLWLVLELVSGGELFDKIQEVEFYSEKDGSRIIEALLRCIMHCHTHHVIHRDLKPENILCGTKEFKDVSDIKLTDFGLSTLCEPGQKTRGSCGSVEFAPPEIIDNNEYDFKVDMWSIGVLSYIVLGGYAPFQDSNQTKLKNLIRNCQFEFHSPEWDEVSPVGRDFISKLLVIDPEKRLSPEEALRHPFIGCKDELKETVNLAASNAFKKYLAQKKLKASVFSVMATNRLSSKLMSGMKNLNSLIQSEGTQQQPESSNPTEIPISSLPATNTQDEIIELRKNLSESQQREASLSLKVQELESQLLAMAQRQDEMKKKIITFVTEL